ncbi:MAG: GAF domain-containing protein [Anaerolineae bacterium]|nr:GAF domain-containing protein [Anaerolineae bacterium]
MRTAHKIMALSLALGLFIWAVDAALLAAGVANHPIYVGVMAIAGFGLLGVLTSRFLARQQKVEKELCRVNRALKTLGECNEVMVRATEESELLHNICQIIVEVGGYHLAWVGFARDDETQSVQPVAQKGYEEGYLESVNITWADTERGRGPTGTAIRTGKPYVVRNTKTDPNFAPWRDEAGKRGYASVLGLPLIAEAKPFGALTIYASEPEAFDPDEVNLLTDLADDLAYGIVALRTQVEHKRAEAALRNSEAKNRALLDAIPDMMVQLNQEGTLLDFKAAKSFAPWLLPDEFLGKNLADVFPPDVAQQVMEQLVQALQTRETQVFEYQLPIDRTLRDYELRLVVSRENEVLGIIRDITKRKASESVIEEERARIARDLHDGLAQSLYFLGLKLDYIRKQIENDREGALDELCALKKTVQANIHDVRRTIFALRPVELEKLGFGPALRKFTREFGEQAGLTVELEVKGDEKDLPAFLEPVFFRLVQEGLNNIAKHASASQAWIELEIEPGQKAQLIIRDNGIGFDTQAMRLTDGAKMGLRQMSERVTTLGGQFSINSTPVQGTILHAEIPLQGAQP